uniref:Uncharacterized protein n=1 Tax=Rhizochromulina marina TaxID=1034831 RepID=A0A7S2WGB5_9STRA|mmetsp:Transcript_23602/g.69058  ORF Transcript_23602/g.69058 Transcript_23602/m.69058 type:complete len:146 (+) Transcript_23602:182-619(+)|eukprot:CAMPEP_0118974086 /NCGR_PEP_ID=MMETSP1173-20130426/11064_1 /TAXON_ID=1034831 /ORGANISM="Rhizochromulina marina cf, Strain CCMP1243" /LENGTH=145 /DNA_ID=CAMNT_0006923791 /DNA_START=147 /DNA_END=584 /DNA_ORIENTATION=+
MGAAASVCKDSQGELFSQLMLKWDMLMQEPQFEGRMDSSSISRPTSYDELLQIEIPSDGVQHDFYMAMRAELLELTQSMAQDVIVMDFREGLVGPQVQAVDLQAAYRNRPQSSGGQRSQGEHRRKKAKTKRGPRDTGGIYSALSV